MGFRQPLDAITLSHLAAALDVKLAGGKLNKIQQPSHTELLLHFWTGGAFGRQKLYINLSPEMAFCSLAEDTSFLTMPDPPPNLCMILRKHLSNATLRHITTLPGERVMNLTWDAYDELNQPVTWVLAIELMGKHSNLVLYDAGMKLITGCAHGVSEAMSRLREIKVGYPYVPPPPQAQPTVQSLSQEVLTELIHTAWQTAQPVETLMQQVCGASRRFWEQVTRFYPTATEASQAVWALLSSHQVAPALSPNGQDYTLLSPTPSDWQPLRAVCDLVAETYLTACIADRIRHRQQQYLKLLKTQQQKLEKRLAQFESQTPDKRETLKKWGDLLMVAAAQTPHWARSPIIVTDWDSQAEVAIEIDPHHSVMENAQQYYQRYKKLTAQAEQAQQQTQALCDQLAGIADLMGMMERAGSLADLAALSEDLVARGWLRVETKGKKAKSLQSVPGKLVVEDTFSVLIGRNQQQNGQLVSKYARPDDLWVHTQNVPGAHLIIQTRHPGDSIPESVIHTVAGWAAYLSQGRQNQGVDVVYTPARYVRKIPGSYPGHVTYTHEQTVFVAPQAPPAF